MGIILALVAYILVAILTPFGILYSLIRRLAYADKYFFNVAVSLDQLGNAIMCVLFNDIMIKKGGSKFGSSDETLSSVYGKNKLSGHLTLLGKSIAWILNKLEKNHVEKSIEVDE